MTNSGSNRSHLERSKTSLQRKKKSGRIGSDVPEQIKPDDQDGKQEEMYRTLIENIPCAVYSALPGEKGPTTFMSPNWKDWAGYSAEEFYQDPEAWPKCIYPDDREKAVNSYIEACEKGVSYNLEYRIVHRDTGQIRYVKDQGLLSKDKQGTLIRIDGIITDITESKKSEDELAKYRNHLEELVKERTAELEKMNEVLKLQDTEHKITEEMLRTSEEKYRSMIELFPAVIVVINKLGFIESCNRALKRITGYSKDELVGKHFTKLGVFRLNEIPKYLYLFARALKGELLSPLEIDFIRKDGSNGTVDVRASLLNDGKIQAIATDITERKKVEEAVRESENRYKAVVDNAQEGIILVQGKMLKFVNPKGTSIMGCSEEELTSRPFIEFVHPEDRDRVMKIHFKRFKSEEVPEVYEFRIVNKQGKTIWLESNGILIDWSGGPATLNFLRDITDRKRAAEALKENEERFRSLSNAAFEGIVITKKGKLVDANAAFTNLFGYEPDEIAGKEVMMLVAPEDRQRVKENIQSGYAKRYEHKGLRKDGSVFDVEVCGKTVLIKGQECRITAIRDISDRKKAEEKFLEYQMKLKSLASQLSLSEERERRRIATELHDQIGQTLVFSKLKLDELQHTTGTSELTKALNEISKNIEQVIQEARTLTFDLSSPVLNEIGFETAVSEWLEERIQEKHGISIEFEDDGQTKQLDDDIRSLLFRNIRELLINVVQHAQASNVKVSICKVGSQICVSVEDDGLGIKSSDITSLTSKSGGFGIFSIRERLEQLGGSLEIDSERGRGSKITMTAPLKLTKPKHNLQNS